MSDEYEKALESDDYKAWKGEPEKVEPAAAPVVEAAPVVDDRPRNPDGTFAQKVEGEAPKPAPAPFEGFDTLDPSIQSQFRRVLGERDDYRLRYTRQLGHTRQLARSANTGPKAPAGEELAGARRDASGLAPGKQREAIQRQLDKWEAHSKAYPDDAAAIDQRIAALRDDLASGINPLAQEVQQLRSVVQELRGGYEAVQAERAERHAQESQSILDTEAGDNWRQIAGWEDDEGRPIPPEKRDWHPEFRSWVESHDPDMQEYLWQTLAHSSPRVAGKVFAEFNRAVFGAEPGAQTTVATTQTDPVAARRAEALRDIQPGGGSAKSAPATWAPSGDDFADAVNSDAYRAWKNA